MSLLEGKLPSNKDENQSILLPQALSQKEDRKCLDAVGVKTYLTYNITKQDTTFIQIGINQMTKLGPFVQFYIT